MQLDKKWPVEILEPLEQIMILPLSDPRIVGGVTKETIKAIQENHHKLYVWGIKNQRTIQQNINGGE